MQRGEGGFGSGWCKIGIYLNVHPCSHLNVEVRYGSTCGFSNRAEASKCGAVPIIADQVENENEFLEKFLERKVLSDFVLPSGLFVPRPRKDFKGAVTFFIGCTMCGSIECRTICRSSRRKSSNSTRLKKVKNHPGRNTYSSG